MSYFQPSELNCTELSEVLASNGGPRNLGDSRMRRSREVKEVREVREVRESPVSTVSATSPFWRHRQGQAGDTRR